MRPLRLALLCVLVPGLLAAPAVAAAQESPAPVTASVTELPVSGVDPAAASAAPPSGTTGALVEGDGRRTVLLTGQLATEPFAMVGVTWDADPAVTDVEAFVRTRTGGTWSPWQVLGGRADEEPDAGTVDAASPRAGTSPLWVDRADGVQARVDVLDGAAPTGLRLSLVDPGESEQDLSLDARLTSSAAGAPVVRTRADWGADETLRRGTPSFAGSTRAVTVHHTASSNDYSAADVPRLIRGFYAYHVKGNGWSDLGYNFLVDRFGRIWEGRAGGTTRPVIGAHAGGFNTGTVGISLIGTYETEAPSAAALEAVAALAGWRLGLAKVDPTSTLTMTSAGSSRYASGTAVQLPAVFGHRQVSSTACPGAQGMAALPGVRSRAKALAAGVAPAPEPVPNGLHVTAPALVKPGETVPLVVRGTPGAAVEVWFRRRGEVAFNSRRSGVLGPDGTFRTSYTGFDEHTFYASSNGRTSLRVTTRLTVLPAPAAPAPPAVQVSAPGSVEAGSPVPVVVTGPPGAPVALWLRRRDPAGPTVWVRVREGRFDAAGRYRTDFVGDEDHDHYATSGTLSSRDVQTLVVPVLSGPTSASLGSRLELLGRARPGDAVVVEARPRGRTDTVRRTLTADATGAFRTPLTLDDEYEYRPVAGGRTGALRRTSVAPTAAAPDAAAAGSTVTVHGTARPGALVEVLFASERRRGLKLPRVGRSATAAPDGSWSVSFPLARTATWWARADGVATPTRTTRTS